MHDILYWVQIAPTKTIAVNVEYWLKQMNGAAAGTEWDSYIAYRRMVTIWLGEAERRSDFKNGYDVGQLWKGEFD